MNAMKPLSSAEAFLCCREAGEKLKKKRAGARWEVEREKRQERLPSFPSSHRYLRAIYFSIIAIFIGIPSGEPLGLWGASGGRWGAVHRLWILSDLFLLG